MACRRKRGKRDIKYWVETYFRRQMIAKPSQRNENYYLSYTLILRRLKILKILTCLEAFQVLRQQLLQQQRGQELPDDDVYVYDANVCVCMFERHEK